MEDEERKIPYIRVLKKDIKGYDEQGITIEHKGKEWKVEYGAYVSKKDIDALDDEDVIYIKKYGRWVVANAVKINNDVQGNTDGEEDMEMLRKELEECKEILRRIAEVVRENTE